MMCRTTRALFLLVTSVLSIVVLLAATEGQKASAASPSDTDADRRADALVARMTLDDKMRLVMSLNGNTAFGVKAPDDARNGAAYLPANERLGLPAVRYTNAGLGVARRHDGGATALPSSTALAASWDSDLALRSGAMVGTQARALGFNLLLGGGVNLVRDPRNGRNFEYAGEDPLLAGTIAGAFVQGAQEQNVLCTVKHFALNELETNRHLESGQIADDALRESDLLAFEIAIERGHPGAVMTSYNRLNDVYTSENSYLLTKVLKQDWHYPGFVMSDWGGTHSTQRAALAGLDQQSAGTAYDSRRFFGAPLERAVRDGEVPQNRLNDMARRIVRSFIATGIIDHPLLPLTALDGRHDRETARQAEEEGAVLLKNKDSILPLSGRLRIAVIGGNADRGVLAGGGSSVVIPLGGNAAPDPGPKVWYGPVVYDPDPPLAWIRKFAETAGATVAFDDGHDTGKARALARASDVVLVFATEWSREGVDRADLSLPDGQDAQISAIAVDNPHTIVVLENNVTPTMPWLSSVAGVLEAWYPGAGGGEAIAKLLFGIVNPSGHLPVTIPANQDQLPRAYIPGAGGEDTLDIVLRQDHNIFHPEGADVGYRWFERSRTKPLFWFGFGLSYSKFHIDAPASRSFELAASVTNVSSKPGTTVVQFYVQPPGHTRRLVGWQRVALAAGEKRRLRIRIDPRSIGNFSMERNRWEIPQGLYPYTVGENVTDEAASGKLVLKSPSYVRP